MTTPKTMVDVVRELADQLEQHRDIARAASPLLPNAAQAQQAKFRTNLDLLREMVPHLRRALRAGEITERVLAKALKPKLWRGIRA